MFGTAQKRLARIVERIDGSRIVENFGGCVGVGGGEQQPAAQPGLQFDFRALGERLVDVEIFTHEGGRVDRLVVDLVVKQIIEVGGIEDVFSAEEILPKARLESPGALGFEAGVWDGKRRTGESLFQARLLESGGVGKAEAGSRKNFSTLQSQQGQRDARYTCVAEHAAVDETPAYDRRKPAPG